MNEDRLHFDASSVYAPSPVNGNISLSDIFRDGLRELREAVLLWRLWTFWGWLDVRQRYRRSLLGPLWVTATMAISVIAIGLVYALLFKQSVREYLPYVAAGFVLWSLITGYIGEAASVFIVNEGFIGQLKLPYLVYPLRLAWRYAVVFFHHAVVLLVVIFIFVPFGLSSLVGSLLGLFFVFFNILWMGILVGLISLRLRDLPILVSTIFQVLFLVTPVIWPAKALGSRAALVELNPFFHMLESVREPLLNQSAAAINHHLVVTMLMALVGCLITFFLYSWWHRRMVYWL